MTTYKHQCSCGNSYSDNDPDIYFCPSCVEQRKAIAKQVDAKMAGRISERAEKKSDIQLYNSLPKIRGFVKASDLGL